MSLYEKDEKIKIIVDISKKLKMFPSKNGSFIDLYNDNYSFVEKFKKISIDWINNEHSFYKGALHFEEINKYFEYNFPKYKNKEPLFVLRNKIVVNDY